MPTATKTKSTKPRDESLAEAPRADGAIPPGYPDLNGLAESLQAERDLLNRCRDGAVAIALSKQSPTDPLSDEERQVFCRAGLERETDVQRLIGACHAARELASRGGNPAQLRAIEVRIENAKKAESEQRPALEKKIAELQSELHALTTAVTSATNELESMQDANARLRECAPPWCRSNWDHERGRVNARFNRRIGELENKIHLANALASMRHSDESAVLHAQGVAGRDLSHPLRPIVWRNPDGTPRGLPEVPLQAWMKYVGDLQAARPVAEAALAKLQSEKAEALNEAKAPTNYFLRLFGLL